jgi:HSP20 family protein
MVEIMRCEGINKSSHHQINKLTIMDLAKYNDNAFPAMPIYFDDHGTRKKFEQAIKAVLNPAPHTPASNILMTKSGYLIELIAPAMKKEDLDISLEGNILEVRTNQQPQPPSRESYAYIQREYYHQGFSRKFPVPVHEINPKKIDATYEDGVLRIHLPFKEGFQGPKALRIDVR